MLWTVILIALILALLGGGTGVYGPGYAPYRGYGFGLGGLLIVVLIVLLVAGRL